MRLSLLGIAAVLTLLTGCEKKSSSGSVQVDRIVVSGHTSENATVTVNHVADEDGIADQSYSVTFQCDDGDSDDSLAADPGISGPPVQDEIHFIVDDAGGNNRQMTIMVTYNP